MQKSMMQRGKLAVISGFSGVGKGTVVKRLLDKYDAYVLSVSATTRAPRQGEEHGVHYFFKTNEEFEQLIAEDAFVEYAGYVNHYYGTLKSFVEPNLSVGRNVILEIEPQGALQVKEKYPEAMLIFITPPSIEELRQRLINRGTETMEVIEQRIARAREEEVFVKHYDHVVINENGKVEQCVDGIHALITQKA